MFLRLFIAIAVPPAVRKEIGRAQGQLQRHAPPGAVRWTNPEQFHVTLKFLGDVPATALDDLQKSVGAVCARFSVFKMSARGIRFFPNAHQPRVIWVGASDDTGALPELNRQLTENLRWLGPAEKFHSHITLGRFKPGRHAAIPKLQERASIFHGHSFGEWPATEVEILRNELTSTGAAHTTISSFSLTP